MLRFEKRNLLEELLSCQAFTLPVLQMAQQEGAPMVVHSDEGRQYAVRDHVDLLTGAGVVISLSDAGAPTQNALAERFARTVKDEHLPCIEYGSMANMRPPA